MSNQAPRYYNIIALLRKRRYGSKLLQRAVTVSKNDKRHEVIAGDNFALAENARNTCSSANRFDKACTAVERHVVERFAERSVHTKRRNIVCTANTCIPKNYFRFMFFCIGNKFGKRSVLASLSDANDERILVKPRNHFQLRISGSKPLQCCRNSKCAANKKRVSVGRLRYDIIGAKSRTVPRNVLHHHMER